MENTNLIPKIGNIQTDSEISTLFPSYPKIETVYERDVDGSKKLIIGKWRDEAIEFTRNLEWVATEKIDGTNVRVCWDGYKVHFLGRTKKAQIQVSLFQKLNELFGGNVNEELFEQAFQDKPAILFGEGYGARVQDVGGRYKKGDVDFCLLDVFMPDSNIWLRREDVEKIAVRFGVRCAPIVARDTLPNLIKYVQSRPTSQFAEDTTLPMEGVVAAPAIELRDRRGRRLIVKIKVKDFNQ